MVARTIVGPSCLVLLLTATSRAEAQAPAPADERQAMAAQLRAQAETIRALEARVAALEERHGYPDGARTLAASMPAEAPTSTAGNEAAPPTRIDWGNGGPEFRVGETASFHVRGRFWLDASATTGSRSRLRDVAGTEVRSLRLGVDGRWGGRLTYKAELDFADDMVAVKDLYFGYQVRAVGQRLEAYVGNKIGDRTIEGSSGDESVPFMERSMLATSIGPEKGIFGVGVLVKVIGSDWHVGLNLSGDDANHPRGAASDTVATTARATWSPSLGERTFLHLGVWGFHEELPSGDSLLTKSVLPGTHFNDALRVNSSPIDQARTTDGAGGEVGYVHGPLWLLGEYGERRIHAGSGARREEAWVASAGVLVTGEQPAFSRATGTWGRLRPRDGVFEGGSGAIELLGRYESVDLGPEGFAGSGREATLGVNWYLSQNVRLMTDWVAWRIRNPLRLGGADAGSSFDLRLETSF